MRIVKEANQCEKQQLGALLRREGIYSAQLTKWQLQLAAKCVEGMEAIRRGRKPSLDVSAAHVRELEHQNTRLQRELTLAQKLIELQKKVSELLNIPLAFETL
jgi:hypothetical protein